MTFYISRKREASEKKEAKLKKLRRLAEGENVGKHDFHDPGYDRERDEATERVHEAIEAAFAGTAAATGLAKEGGDVGGAKRKRNENDGPAKKKSAGLWLGDGLDDLDDEDLSDSDDEEAPENSTKEVVAV